MEKIQIKPKVTWIHDFFKYLAAYVCGGVMFTIIFSPTIKEMQGKINALDSASHITIENRKVSIKERHMIMNKLGLDTALFIHPEKQKQ